MPRVHKAKPFHGVRNSNIAAQANRRFSPDTLPVEDIKNIWKGLNSTERQSLFTFDKALLQQRAIKYTRLDVDQAKEECAASQAEAQEHNNACLGPMCQCGSHCKLEISVKQLQASLLEQYADAMKKMQQAGSWKRWRFSKDSPAFTSPDAFRAHLEEHILKPELQILLPRTSGSAAEVAAQREFEDYLSVLNTTCNQDLKTLWQHVAKLNDIQRDLPMYGAIGAEERILREQVEDGSIRLLRTLMGSSKLEAQSFADTLMGPMAAFVHGRLPSQKCPGGSETELCWADLKKLASADVFQLAHWACERLAVFASHHAQVLLQVNAKVEHEAEGKLQNVDPLMLTDSGDAMTLRPEWVQHLESQVFNKRTGQWKTGYAADQDPTGALLPWILGEYTSKYELLRRLVHLDELPSPEKNLQLLEESLKVRSNTQQELSKHRKLLSSLRALAQHTDQLCLQYAAVARCLERPESDTIPTAEPASVSATECDNSSGLKDLDACFDFLYRKGSLRTAPQLSRGAERTTPTAFSTPGKAASPSHTHDAVPDPELPGLASRGSNSCKAEGEVASWSELPDEAIIALLKREELLALAETRSYEVSINSLTKQLTGMQRHIRQAMPEYKRQKAEVDAAEELKKHRQCSGDVPSRKGKGCRGKSCNNPCCAAAEAVQREMPFLDKEAASKLVRARHLFKEYRQHIEGLVKGSKDIRTQIRNAEERSAYVRATSEKGRDMMTLLNAGLAAPEQATQPPSEANGAAEDTPTIPCSKAASLQAVPQAAVSLLSIEARCFRETGRHFDQVMDSAVQHSEIPADSKQQLRLHQQEYLGSLFAMLDVDMGICVGQELSAAVRRAFSKEFYKHSTTRKSELSSQQYLQEQQCALESVDACTRAALIQLEAQVINAACENPGFMVMHDLVLPMVRERLLGKVHEAQQAAAQAVTQASKTEAQPRQAEAQAGHHAGLNKVAANSVIADALGELDLNVDPQEMKAAAKKAKKLRHKANKRQRSSDASQVA